MAEDIHDERRSQDCMYYEYLVLQSIFTSPSLSPSPPPPLLPFIPLSFPSPSPSLLLPFIPGPLSPSSHLNFQCMLHTSHPDKEIVLQILGLLRLITLNANLKAQDLLYEEISNRDSVFCGRVYMLLEDVISTFKETWAKLDSCITSVFITV